MRVIISSAGRRVYLVTWFQEAMRQARVAGDVYVLDHDPHAAAAAAADGYREVPAFSSPKYAPQVLKIVNELQPDLFISLNDHELTVLSQGLSDLIRANGVVVPVLDAAAHRAVADKLTMNQTLRHAGISTPETVLLSNRAAVHALIDRAPAIIVKDRWGSGSSGLRRFTPEEARCWVTTQFDRHHGMTTSELDSLIIQPDLGGVEYGLDVITGVRGGPVEGVLARRKLGMRYGETARAITVPNAPFLGLAAALNAALGIQGTIDVDVLLTDDGIPHVIDVNPRFGGGYPFSHMAGADVPHFFVASTLHMTPRPGWDSYREGYIASKHEGIIGFETVSDVAAQKTIRYGRVLRT